MTSKYEPIACDVYASYELAIMRRQCMRVAWRAPRGDRRVETLRPVDLRTRRGAEYMLVDDRLGRRRLGVSQSYDQEFLVYPEAHVALPEVADSAEHGFLHETGLTDKIVDTLLEPLAVTQSCLLPDSGIE